MDLTNPEILKLLEVEKLRRMQDVFESPFKYKKLSNLKK